MVYRTPVPALLRAIVFDAPATVAGQEPDATFAACGVVLFWTKR